MTRRYLVDVCRPGDSQHQLLVLWANDPVGLQAPVEGMALWLVAYWETPSWVAM